MSVAPAPPPNENLPPLRQALADLRVFLGLGRRYSWWLWGGAALAATTTLAAIGLLGLAGWFLTASGLAGIAAAGLGAYAFNFHFPSGGIRSFMLVRVLSRYAERLVTHEATFRILASIRVWVFAKAIPLAPGRLGEQRSGAVLASVTSDVDALDNLYLRLLTPAIAALAGLAAILIVVGLINPLAALACCAIFVFAALAAPIYALSRAARPSAQANASLAEARAEAADLIDGLAELKAFQADDRVLERLNTHTNDQLDNEDRAARAGAHAAGIIAASGAVAALITFAIAAAFQAPAPLAALAALAVFALFEAAPPLAQAAELFGRTAAAARRLLRLEETRPTAAEPAKSSTAPAASANDVSFTKVSLTYPNAPAPAVRDLTLYIQAGARLGLVGPSGAGKSSLFGLLLRFYDPSEGELTLGGVDVTTMRQAAMRARIAYLGQRSELISATVAANLRIAQPHAQDSQLWSALARARADDVVRALPEGLDTWIGEDGQLLSGGQARRIALARAFLKDAAILALDEPTEGLDTQTEADIIAALADELDRAPRTVIIATHRPALLALTDTVARLEDGVLTKLSQAEPTPPGAAGAG